MGTYQKWTLVRNSATQNRGRLLQRPDPRIARINRISARIAAVE
jgi:hypothetical protein